MNMGMPPRDRPNDRQSNQRQQQQRKTDNELMMESVTSLPSHDGSDGLAGLQPTTSRVQITSRSPRSLGTNDNDYMRNWNEGVREHHMQKQQQQAAAAASPRHNNQFSSSSSSSSPMPYGSNSPTSRQIVDQRLVRESVSGNSENVRPMDKNTVSKASPVRGGNKPPQVGSFPPMTSDLSDLSAINAGVGGGVSSLLRRSVDSSISASVDFNRKSDTNDNHNYNEGGTKGDENDDLEDFEHLSFNNTNTGGNEGFSTGPLTNDTDATGDLTEIDKRIMALQSFLENARSGIFEENKGTQ